MFFSGGAFGTGRNFNQRKGHTVRKCEAKPPSLAAMPSVISTSQAIQDLLQAWDLLESLTLHVIKHSDEKVYPYAQQVSHSYGIFLTSEIERCLSRCGTIDGGQLGLACSATTLYASCGLSDGITFTSDAVD